MDYRDAYNKVYMYGMFYTQSATIIKSYSKSTIYAYICIVVSLLHRPVSQCTPVNPGIHWQE